jgi:hypothetical protein
LTNSLLIFALPYFLFAKREYETVLSLLLRGKQEDGQLEEKLELLRLFLESADFDRLRSLSEEPLLNGKRVEFILKSILFSPRVSRAPPSK